MRVCVDGLVLFGVAPSSQAPLIQCKILKSSCSACAEMTAWLSDEFELHLLSSLAPLFDWTSMGDPNHAWGQ